MMKPTGPLFKWFGSKWLSARLMPVPEHSIIVEPFAGSAGYSLRYADRQVVICEINPFVYQLWYWLILHATEADIRAIPLGVPEGTDIRTLGLSVGQELLLKHWQRTNNVGSCWTVSPWGNKPGQWTANTRARVAEEVQAVKHWILRADGMRALSDYHTATWFVDPPYQYNYQYKSAPIDYGELGRLVRAAQGQKIVCEAVCPKTGAVPTWLPFEPFGERITSRRKATENHHSKELIYHDRA